MPRRVSVSQPLNWAVHARPPGPPTIARLAALARNSGIAATYSIAALSAPSAFSAVEANRLSSVDCNSVSSSARSSKAVTMPVTSKIMLVEKLITHCRAPGPSTMR